MIVYIERVIFTELRWLSGIGRFRTLAGPRIFGGFFAAIALVFPSVGRVEEIRHFPISWTVLEAPYASRLNDIAEAIPADLRCVPWPAHEELGFWNRASHAIRHSASAGRYGNTYFENEKRAYGKAMISVLAGFREPGLKFLQEQDNQHESWHRETRGIDFYAAFTIKHQMRKYFFFGPFLQPTYLETMKAGAKLWTEADPLTRKHYAYNDSGVWGPDKQNSWVDPRSTDNLKLMRECAVFLFAKETGNHSTAQIYKKRLIQFISTYCHFGMGEWDSENYLGHSLSPLLCLYDFAEDRELKAAARTALDRICLDAAIRYFHGQACGPSRRDYNHPYTFGGSLASLFWLYFGDSDEPKEEWEFDEIHLITSAYRPPLAALHIARKQFPMPAELQAHKTDWASWKNVSKDMNPTYFESSLISHSYQMGTLAFGTQNPDVNGFKICFLDNNNKAHAFWAGPSMDVTRLGSPQYLPDIHPGRSRVFRSGRSALYLNTNSNVPFRYVLPERVSTEIENGKLHIQGSRFFAIAIPLGCGTITDDPESTDRLRWDRKNDTVKPRWPDLSAWKTGTPVNPTYGFVIHTGDRESHGSFEAFAEQVHQLKVPTYKNNGESIEWQALDSEVIQTAPGILMEKSAWMASRLQSGTESQPVLAIDLRGPDGRKVIQSGWGSTELTVRLPGTQYSSEPDMSISSFE